MTPLQILQALYDRISLDAVWTNEFQELEGFSITDLDQMFLSKPILKFFEENEISPTDVRSIIVNELQVQKSFDDLYDKMDEELEVLEDVNNVLPNFEARRAELNSETRTLESFFDAIEISHLTLTAQEFENYKDKLTEIKNRVAALG